MAQAPCAALLSSPAAVRRTGWTEGEAGAPAGCISDKRQPLSGAAESGQPEPRGRDRARARLWLHGRLKGGAAAAAVAARGQAWPPPGCGAALEDSSKAAAAAATASPFRRAGPEGGAALALLPCRRG